MTFKEIQDLIKLVNKSNLSEFRMKDGDFKLTIRTERHQKKKDGGNAQQAVPQMHYPQVMPIAAPSAIPPPAVPTPDIQPDGATPTKTEHAETTEDTGNYVKILSPIVGTFYRSPSPEKPPYLKVGDVVEVGSVVCIVEAMKLFNEIESEVAGKIVKVLVEDAQPVEYDQELFLVDPN
ncbi:MAG: acetyl-CoA carboxylase biotin carboxyl carrier protein [Bacteroidetes bacterium]|nr:acetyl-CoA carboxylase biotin carboxyl carrier protein [Bacteroidota bacterium]